MGGLGVHRGQKTALERPASAEVRMAPNSLMPMEELIGATYHPRS